MKKQPAWVRSRGMWRRAASKRVQVTPSNIVKGFGMMGSELYGYAKEKLTSKSSTSKSAPRKRY
jgi:hypothetical protein